MNTTYRGKGRPRKTDVGYKVKTKPVMQSAYPRDYDAELRNSTKRAELGEIDSDGIGLGTTLLIVIVSSIIIAWEIYSRFMM